MKNNYRNYGFFMMLIIILFMMLLINISVFAQGNQPVPNQEKSNKMTPIEQLQQINYDGLALEDNKIDIIMREVAKTQRVDVLLLLIKGLAFNSNPNISNEFLSQEGMIPAIMIINDNYSLSSLPYLYVEGINTDKNWMRERCALAIRTIASPDQIKNYNKIFSLNETTSTKGKELFKLIMKENLQIKLYDGTEKYDNIIQEILEKKHNEMNEKKNMSIEIPNEQVKDNVENKKD